MPRPIVWPSTQWFGSGFGHIGSTSNSGRLERAAILGDRPRFSRHDVPVTARSGDGARGSRTAMSKSRLSDHSDLDELLHALALEVLARVDVALRVHGDAADAVESARPAPAAADARDDRERVAIEHEHLLILTVGHVQKRCCGSRENATSHTAPSPVVVFDTNASFTNVPSLRKTWMRSLRRSQT